MIVQRSFQFLKMYATVFDTPPKTTAGDNNRSWKISFALTLVPASIDRSVYPLRAFGPVSNFSQW